MAARELTSAASRRGMKPSHLRFTAADGRKMIANPIYAGIGPYAAGATVQVGSATCRLAVETIRRGSV
jgi:hypothetical protein